MKRLILISIFATLSIFTSLAQEVGRQKGSISINAGIGVSTFEAVNQASKTVLPPVKLEIDYTVACFSKDMSLSAGAYYGMSVESIPIDGASETSYLLGPMATYRCAIIDKLDFYVKGILGVKCLSARGVAEDMTLRDFGLGYGLYLGGTWYFSPKVGLGAEIGYGGPANLGIHLAINL